MADTSIKHDNYTSDDITDYHYCCHNVAGNHSGKFIVYPDNAQSGENGFSDIFVSIINFCACGASMPRAASSNSSCLEILLQE